LRLGTLFKACFARQLYGNAIEPLTLGQLRACACEATTSGAQICRRDFFANPAESIDTTVCSAKLPQPGFHGSRFSR
jgi:hypothetical protein